MHSPQASVVRSQYGEFLARPFRQLRDAWEGGDINGLLEALDLARRFKVPLPNWLHEALAMVIRGAEVTTKVPGRHARPMTRLREDIIDITRWDAVREALRNGGKWTDGACFSVAAKALRGTRAAAPPDTVRKSYLRVQKRLKQDPRRYRLNPAFQLAEFNRQTIDHGLQLSRHQVRVRAFRQSEVVERLAVRIAENSLPK